MDNTSTKQQKPYPPPKYLEFTKIRSERIRDIKFITNSQSKMIIALGWNGFKQIHRFRGSDIEEQIRSLKPGRILYLLTNLQTHR
jgi:hypothetical protein